MVAAPPSPPLVRFARVSGSCSCLLRSVRANDNYRFVIDEGKDCDSTRGAYYILGVTTVRPRAGTRRSVYARVSRRYEVRVTR